MDGWMGYLRMDGMGCLMGRVGRMDGWPSGTGGRSQKVSFNFLHTLWVKDYVYIYLYTK